MLATDGGRMMEEVLAASAVLEVELVAEIFSDG